MKLFPITVFPCRRSRSICAAAPIGCRGDAPFYRARPPFATVFLCGLPYNSPTERKGGGALDRGVCGQRVCAERADGLSAGALRRASGGHSPPAETLPSGGPAGGRLCRGGISAGAGLSLRNAGEAGGRHTAGAGGLWRRGKAAAADAAAVRRLLCHGRVRAGPGPGGGGRRADGERRVLHGRGCKGAADRCGRGLSGSDSGVSCGGGKGRPGRAGAGTGVSGRADHGVYRFLRHGKRPAGSGLRGASAGGVSGAVGRRASKRGPLSAGPRIAGASRRAAGAHDAGGAGAAVPSDPLPRGGSGGRTAAGGAQRLDGGGGGAVCRTAGCLFPHRAGDGIQRPVGRRGWKEKKP